MVRIDDPADPRLADYRQLQSAGQQPDPRRFIAESEHVVARLLASEFAVASVLGTASHLERLAPALAARPELPVYVAEQAVIAAAVGFNFHRGVAACGLRPAALAWNDMAQGTDYISGLEDMRFWTDDLSRRPRFTVAIAQGLTDPANVGAIVRTARAFAVDLVVVDRRGADPLSRRAIRAAAGQVFAQPIVVACDLGAVVAALQRAGVMVVAATLSAQARPVARLARPARLAVMVGNEGCGLPAALCAAADAEVTIPIADGVDSLGVAAATAVLLYALADPAPTGL